MSVKDVFFTLIFRQYQVPHKMNFAGKTDVNNFLTIRLQQADYALLYIIITLRLLHLMVGNRVSR